MIEYLQPMARNLRTGQTVQQQNLNRVRYRSKVSQERAEAQAMADSLAQKMTESSGDSWQGLVKSYVMPSAG